MQKGAELNGEDMNQCMESVLDAMKAIAPVGDIYAKDPAEAAPEA